MKRGIKTTMIIGIVLLAAGMALCFASYKIGFQGGFALTDRGEYIDLSHGSEAPRMVKTEVEKFSQVTVEAECDVILEHSDVYGVEYDTDGLTCSIDQGRLTIKSRPGRPNYLIYWGQERNRYVKIYYPDSLEEVNLTSRYGGISVSDLTCNRLTVSCESGDLKLKHVTAEEEISLQLEYGDMKLEQIKSGEFAVKGEAGDLQFSQMKTEGLFQAEWNYGDVALEQITAGEILLRGENGDVKLNEFDAADTDISTEYGDVKAKVSGNKQEYQYHLTAEYGEVWFEGTERSHVFTKTGQSDKQVNISVENGTIQMN